MFVSPYVLFGGIFAVVICFEYDFLSRSHILCDTSVDKRDYAELFCMARTQNLKSSGEGAYLRNYGRWQFYIIIQMFIVAVICRIDLKMRDLANQKVTTIGKRYILTMCILLSVIVCWTLSYLSLGGYFNSFISRLIYHSIDRRVVHSPIADVFPLEAECFVEPLDNNATYTTTCKLPLNETTPFYFITLFVLYLLGLLWVTQLVLELAYEKMEETRRIRREQLKINILALNGMHHLEEDVKKVESSTRREQIDLLNRVRAKFLLKLKSMTKPKPQISASSPYAPLTTTVP